MDSVNLEKLIVITLSINGSGPLLSPSHKPSLEHYSQPKQRASLTHGIFINVYKIFSCSINIWDADKFLARPTFRCIFLW